MLRLLPSLKSKKIVLASQSPRRKEILSMIGLQFEVVPSTFPETLDKSKFTPEEYVVQNAIEKALEVASRLGKAASATVDAAAAASAAQLQSGAAPADLIIGSDTVVVHEDRILEKPSDPEAAVAMLASLSGTRHRVLSGVALVLPATDGGSDTHIVARSWCSTTFVQFDNVSAEDIQAYIATGEPFDKAGGYGIQSMGGLLVKGVEGDYQNVKGFPLFDFGKQMASLAAEHWGDSE